MRSIRTIVIIGVMAAATFLAAGCQKEEKGTVTLGVSIDNGRHAKVFIDKTNICWHNGDMVYVNSETCATSSAAADGSTANLVGVTGSASYRAIYPASLVEDATADISGTGGVQVKLPRVQNYEQDSYGDQKVVLPMGAYSDNTTLTFHSLCPLIKVVISSQMTQGFWLDSITVAATDTRLSGVGTATMNEITLDDPSDIATERAVSLAFNRSNRTKVERGDRNTYVYYIAAPAFVNKSVTITVWGNRGQYATFPKGSVSLQSNSISEVFLTVDHLDGEAGLNEGELLGLFSVSPTRWVHFSQGNLQYQPSTTIWRFAANQYDFVGGTTWDFENESGDIRVGNVYLNDNNSSEWSSNNYVVYPNYAGWLDLFGWGTGADPTFAEYLGDASSNSFVDWGVNAISNGGNMPDVWRTLSGAEWHYLFFERPGAGSRWGLATVCGMKGVILLPDLWSGMSITSGGENGYGQNTYNVTEWGVMQSAGAVFLPAAGERWYSDGEPTVSYSYVSDGKYWSSTVDEYNNPYYVCFNSDNGIGWPYTGNPAMGYSVRLVQDL